MLYIGLMQIFQGLWCALGPLPRHLQMQGLQVPYQGCSVNELGHEVCLVLLAVYLGQDESLSSNSSLDPQAASLKMAEFCLRRGARQLPLQQTSP